MQTPSQPADERARLTRLRLLNILDTEPEERFDRLTRMARRLFSVPIAMVTLVDAERQWFKSHDGIEATETPRDVSFCAHAVASGETLQVEDARLDDRFFDNPLVMGDPNIRFYAGCPPKVGAHNLGTLCVIDDKPRSFNQDDLKMLQDLAEMAEQELASLHMATTDNLTTLSNQRGFGLLAEHSLRMCRRLTKPSTLLLFDLDHFKFINDTHGHAVGDQALKRFAESLLTVFRGSDVIGRIGGDEFAVLLTGTDSAHADRAADRLREWLTAEQIKRGEVFTLRFSVGQVEFDPERHEKFETLLAHADQEMYRNKRGSRGLV